MVVRSGVIHPVLVHMPPPPLCSQAPGQIPQANNPQNIVSAKIFSTAWHSRPQTTETLAVLGTDRIVKDTVAYDSQQDVKLVLYTSSKGMFIVTHGGKQRETNRLRHRMKFWKRNKENESVN